MKLTITLKLSTAQQAGLEAACAARNQELAVAATQESPHVNLTPQQYAIWVMEKACESYAIHYL
jgi:hypothetical protein